MTPIIDYITYQIQNYDPVMFYIHSKFDLPSKATCTNIHKEHAAEEYSFRLLNIDIDQCPIAAKVFQIEGNSMLYKGTRPLVCLLWGDRENPCVFI